jgi:hypothetical protein
MQKLERRPAMFRRGSRSKNFYDVNNLLDSARPDRYFHGKENG